jgi:hypothetical protein
MGRAYLTEYVHGFRGALPPYHPECGYLCPSPGVRRSVRLALVFGVVGMLIGAVGALSLLDERLARTAVSDSSFAFAWTDRNEADKFSIQANSNGLLSRDVALPIPEDCRESVRSFFDRSCRFVRKHKPRGAPSTIRLTDVGIGRNDAAKGTLEHEPPAVDVGSAAAKSSQGEDAVATTHTSALREKSTKVARARKHLRIPNEDAVDAFASASTGVERHGYQNVSRPELRFNVAGWGRTWW